MTLEAQPHQVYANPSNITELGHLANGVPNQYSRATLVNLTGIYGGSPTNFTAAHDILISNCLFLYPDRAIGASYLSNVVVQSCDFVCWDATNFFTDQTKTSPSTLFTVPDITNYVTIMGYDVLNIEVSGCTWNGNTTLAATNSAPATNRLAPDGFIWYIGNSSTFIGRNAISNNWLEAVQLQQGPSAVVGNTFFSFVDQSSECAILNFAGGNTPSLGYATSIVGNWIYGNRCGDLGSEGIGADPVQTENFVCGNYFHIYPSFTYDVADITYSAPIGLSSCGFAGVCGNTCDLAEAAYISLTNCGRTFLFQNNFSGVTASGILDEGGGVTSLTNAEIFGNVVGQGAGPTVRLPIGNASGWFLKGNQWRSGSSSVTAFIDPASAPIHLSQ